MKRLKKKKKLLIFLGSVLGVILIGVLIFYIWAGYAVDSLMGIYESRRSKVVLDRNNEVISIMPNKDGYYTEYIDEIPQDFADELISSEDKYFYFHPGVNPFSTARALWNSFFNASTASSTITQQLAKILLGNEKDRTFINKVIEYKYALALEAKLTKEEILKMYVNSIYLGNQVQGIEAASRLYYGKTVNMLNNAEREKIIASITSPSQLNPFADEENFSEAEYQKRSLDFKSYINNASYFEFKDLPGSDECLKKDICRTTIDKELTAKIREVINRHLIDLSVKNAKHAAVIVIRIPENEVLAVVGSPDPNSILEGDQINMAFKNRPIGSTIKPFIYGAGFSLGLRPYSLVDDREYKYVTALGFAHYPKNFDYQYRGIISLHEALSNSLNVPTVKVLEFIGLNKFYEFLEKGLHVNPPQSFEKYQYGIALGQLEMTLYDLAYAFTVFPNEGKNDKGERVLETKYVQLINKLLQDRDTGSEQFGIVSNLNLPYKNYAVKTGTSREYHDSWTVGYTPDFLVAVWVGNAQNTAMDEVAGSIGAGGIWHDVMLLLYNSKYNKDTKFKFDKIKSFYDAASATVDYGLAGDDYEKAKNLLIKKALISFPHDGDEFLYETDMILPLESDYEVEWFVDDKKVDEGSMAKFTPDKEGSYEIRAYNNEFDSEIIRIEIVTFPENS
ncbi:transglycosylase domain-containing protein [Candidatus Peregrinibacteria bacterium]|nr:transglycosylase domain-containing protein [Candidatus Peregrinibacteria bacterium]